MPYRPHLAIHPAILHKALKAKDITIWDDWRKGHPKIYPDLNRAHLSRADLSRADLSGANLSWANLRAADLNGANLRKADLNGAALSGAHLTGADLSGADLSEANLIGADLRKADLTEADLRGANLSRVQLSLANLTDANLGGAHLSGADLSGARLFRADLSGADLSEANLSDATLVFTAFADIDLSTTKGLDTALHAGPSYLDVNTIYKSGGNIPEAFLRAVGVPDDMITYIRHQIGTAKAIQFYSAFISYSSKDDDFAKRLHADLRAQQVRVWFAPEEMKIGDEIRPRIDEAIRIYDKLMVVLSEASIKSEWVKDEVEAALEKERRENRLVLFPIRLDDEVMGTDQAWAAKLRRQRHIGDFTKWKQHDDYQKAFERLLRDLKAESQPPEA